MPEVFNYDDFDLVLTNAKTPVMILLDVSASMDRPVDDISDEKPLCTKSIDGQIINFYDTNKHETYFKRALKALNKTLKALKENEITNCSADVCIMTYSDDVQNINDFSSLDEIDGKTPIERGDNTNLPRAIDIALKALDSRIESYKECGNDFYYPSLFIISDGESSCTSGLMTSLKRLNERIFKRKISLNIFELSENQKCDLYDHIYRKPFIKISDKIEECFEFLDDDIALP